MKVTDPWLFCSVAAENILISDESSHRMQIFSKEVNLIKTPQD